MVSARITLCLIAGVSALRSSRSRGNSTVASRVEGSSGQVDSIYTFGSPGSGSPGLQNMGSSSCIGGIRTWHEKSVEKDTVAWILNDVGFWHAKMAAKAIKIQNLGAEYSYSCSSGSMKLPSSGGMNFNIHSPLLYDVTSVMRFPSSLHDVTHFAIREGYEMDAGQMASKARARGWRLVGSGFESGDSSVISGPQVSHLLQHPTSLECIVTFMGTGSTADWLGNLAVSPTPFCGLTMPHETCNDGKTCQTQKSRGSFAHSGFAQKLTKMVMSSSWQSNVRAHLPSCSKVMVGGQSAGAAMSELFAACVSNAPASGDFGYDSYKYMGWTVGTAKKLPYK